MRRWIKRRWQHSALRRLLAGFQRLRTPWAYYGPAARQSVQWAWRSSEAANFTYDLTAKNKEYLAAFVSAVTRCSLPEAEAFIREVENDAALRVHVGGGPYGRRLGWYALARALKPRVVIETGVYEGLGSCVLSAALLRNASEGHPGQYFGTDIDPEAGKLYRAPYVRAGEILYGDSLASLEALKQRGIRVDLFINDSDHSASYERREYELIAGALSERAVIIADNAHATRELYDFARATGRAFLFFQEEPLDHWYPGSGIGVAYTPAPFTV